MPRSTRPWASWPPTSTSRPKPTCTHAAYEGTVRANAFQLGKFLGDESVIRDVTLNGSVAGMGFVPPYARGAAPRSRCPAIWLNGYRYRNIDARRRLPPAGLQRARAVNDPAVRLHGRRPH